MPGIIVGVDGSAHSKLALVRAAKEARLHHEPLTVLTVHQAVMGYSGGAMVYPGDLAETEKRREAAQAETDKVLADLTDPGRSRSRSRRSTVSRPKSSSTRAGPRTWWSWARAERAVSS